MISELEKKLYERLQLPLVMYTETDGSIKAELVSDGLCQSVGVDRNTLMEQLGVDLFARVHPDDKEQMERIVDNFLHKMGSFDLIFRNRRANETGYRIVHAIGKWQPLADGTEAALLSYCEMQDPEGKLSRLMSYSDGNDDHNRDLVFRDTITGLPNLMYLRQFSNSRLRFLRSCEKTPVMIYCDVQSLHKYNIRYGYAKGDELLHIYANMLKKHFPAALIGRGADDHIILIDEYTSEPDIREKISAVNSEAKELAFGITDGIRVGVCKLEPDMDAVQAVDHSRRALKDIGNDLNVICQFYHFGKDDKYWKEQYILENLDRALENGWIKVFYQPIIRVETEKYTALEGLARWIDPAYGMLSPGDFIPVLSKVHLLYRLDLYMAEQICKDYHLRGEVGLPLIPVTLNISAQDFDYVDVVGQLNAILERYGVPRDRLVVEITEQDIAMGTEHFKSELKRLRANGYKLWVDDFGSAYSSLSVFSQFEFDLIKFDMDLLKHMDEHNGVNRGIMQAFVKICREMGIHTLAEGVETQAQLDFLKKIDCELAQGFLIHVPESVEASAFIYKSMGPFIAHESEQERVEKESEWVK